MKRTIQALLLAATVAAAIGGCGGGGDSGTEGGESGAEPVPSSEVPGIAVISAKRIPDFAEVLVDTEGRTVYVFQKDKHSLHRAFSSACYGACAEKWPPVLTEGEPEAYNGAFPPKLSTLKRRNGTLQVVYYGHPLYTYVGDKETGDHTGNHLKAFGGEWSALGPNGEEPKS
jgi:predicted lipoprotein with Yx(FWY)xxD motif